MKNSSRDEQKVSLYCARENPLLKAVARRLDGLLTTDKIVVDLAEE